MQDWMDENLEEFSLEDILAEFADVPEVEDDAFDIEDEAFEVEDEAFDEEEYVPEKPAPKVEKKPVKKAEKVYIDDDDTPVIDLEIFDEIKEQNQSTKEMKKQAKEKKGFSTFDVFRKKKAKKIASVSGEPAHAVLADRPQVKKEHTGKLSSTIDLNDLFENGDEYDAAIEEKNEVYETPGDYVRHNALSVRGLAFLNIINAVLSVLAIYFNFGENIGLFVPEFLTYKANPELYLIVSGAILVAAILVNIKIFWRGLKGILEAAANMYSMVVVSSVASLAHDICMILNAGVRDTMPYCGVSVILLFFMGLGHYFRESGRLRACKAASSSSAPQGIYISERGGDINLIKHPVEETEPFTKYVCMIDGAERFWTYLAPILLIASLIAAGISSIGIGKAENFFWAYAAITSVIAPFFMLICYGLPFSKLTKKLSVLGAALGGWYAAFSLSGKRNLIMRDSDLFPKGSITSHGLKVFNDFPLELIVSYATSMLSAAKSGLYPLFAEILKSHYGKCERVNQLMHHESGGMQGEIQGDIVLLGKESFMHRMGVKILERSQVKNTMYLAINGRVAAAFNLKYRLGDEVKEGLYSCVRGKVSPVLASVDCNLTPVMIESEMELKSGTIAYPNIEERLDLSGEEQYLEYDPCAFITRAGLTPFAAAVNSARRLRKITIRNTVLSTICAVAGLLLMFYITFVCAYDAASPYNVFLYMLLWTLSVYIISSRCNIN